MEHDVAPVLQNPGTLFVSFGRGGLVTAGFHLHTNFIGECMHLAGAGSGGDDEEIHNRGDAGEVKDHRILTAILFAEFGNVASVFQAALQTILGAGCGNGGGNGKTPEANQQTDGTLSSNGLSDS